MSFKDHFSDTADRYARYRPGYPNDLFAYLGELAPGRERAWDCGAGSGQAAAGLAGHFERVFASDASVRQIGERRVDDRVAWVVCLAEAVPLATGSVDLVTAAQAVHWFDYERFYTEARRVLRPGGVIAVWSYNLCKITPAVDEALARYYKEVVGPYWPAERTVVETGYRTIPFPFEEVVAPEFEMIAEWSLPELMGYLSTWSSSRGYRNARNANPIDEVRAELTAAWGDEERTLRIAWPLGLRVGRWPGRTDH